MLTDAAPTDVPWDTFHRRWRQLEPPLRPHPTVCAALREQIAHDDARVLLLGVTPELADLSASTLAIDWSDNMLAHVWPGDTPTRRALKANWLHLPCPDRSFSAAIGDGSLNCLEYPCDYRRLFHELARVVRPGGRVAVRVYATPDPCESTAAVQGRAMAGRIGTIHALKWRLANALSAQATQPNVSVQSILDTFNRLFPDRLALRCATGWEESVIAQIDAFEGLPDVHSFPTLKQLLASITHEFEAPRLVPSGSYELAERCPLLVMDVRQ
ncbi:MAG TPA: methyltransferase domain-containing protein [Gemmatimonadales bacterium]|nr:methyltransferase domain-containing protein [Gemmatimonadales bacterium]